MELLSIFDPDLFPYKDDNLASKEFQNRLKKLLEHKRITHECDAKIAMSDSFLAVLKNEHPHWKENPSLRDFPKLYYPWLSSLMSKTVPNIPDGHKDEINIQPSDVVCKCIKNPEIIFEWKKIVSGCIDQSILKKYQPLIATWSPEEHPIKSQSVKVVANDPKTKRETKKHDVFLVWDSHSWSSQLRNRYIKKCFEVSSGIRTSLEDRNKFLCLTVKTYFDAHPTIKNHLTVLRHPITFDTTAMFWRTIDTECKDDKLRLYLVDALTRKVYGVHDSGLRDKPVKGSKPELFEFRVTGFWRVFYSKKGNCLILKDFGHT